MLAILRVVTRSFPSLSHLACGASSLFSPSSSLPSHTLCSSNSNSRSSSTAHNSSMAASTKAAAIERVWDAPPCLHPAAADGQQQQQQQQQPRRLMLYNSLVDEKVVFVPAAGEGSSQISWYTCGPTVYDSAHMGHARNYVSLDIARRVLEDYFQYNCLFVMNVTDMTTKSSCVPGGTTCCSSLPPPAAARTRKRSVHCHTCTCSYK